MNQMTVTIHLGFFLRHSQSQLPPLGHVLNQKAGFFASKPHKSLEAESGAQARAVGGLL